LLKPERGTARGLRGTPVGGQHGARIGAAGFARRLFVFADFDYFTFSVKNVGLRCGFVPTKYFCTGARRSLNVRAAVALFEFHSKLDVSQKL
jgi:hypothetical protein